jgi:hypothetical protein
MLFSVLFCNWYFFKKIYPFIFSLIQIKFNHWFWFIFYKINPVSLLELTRNIITFEKKIYNHSIMVVHFITAESKKKFIHIIDIIGSYEKCLSIHLNSTNVSEFNKCKWLVYTMRKHVCLSLSMTLCTCYAHKVVKEKVGVELAGTF